ncbi:MAG: hypothetical protein HOO99_18565, partial [Hyphomicrobiaceae bacterium]|nr:hypothetical protein [Hyphomicrobiaceae bacterium]
MPDDKVWEEIRHAYEHTSITVKDLQATYNVSEADFRKRREAERWTTRSGVTAMLKAGAAQRAAAKFAATTDQEPVQEPVRETLPQPTTVSTSPQSSPVSRRNHAARKAPTSANRKAVITRLSTAIDNKLVTLEARMARELSTIDNIDEISAADIERDIRAIGQLI